MPYPPAKLLVTITYTTRLFTVGSVIADAPYADAHPASSLPVHVLLANDAKLLGHDVDAYMTVSKLVPPVHRLIVTLCPQA